MVEEQKLHIPKAAKQDWETPVATFKYLDERFGPFDLDAACTPEQLTAMTILTRGGRILIDPTPDSPPYGPPVSNWPSDVLERISEDGIASPWSGTVWLNPPFNALGMWLDKATKQVQDGNADVVCILIPSRTDTAYWQQFVITELRRTTPWDRAPASSWQVDAHPLLHTVVNLPGRLTFIGADGPFTQPCKALIYGHHENITDKEHS